ncbi:MAG: hypothetical protein MSH25_11160 [Desulfovibrio sp.]|uniref:hypothetical protein n=1 Tax=Desulfovibrio sp. TaxID=885 RepID=UPI0025C5858C|nr:hypothetical protein [Desulfovibrio sp.]MCI7569895.1 hypothetical protein [Desulfovibrio sp.]
MTVEPRFGSGGRMTGESLAQTLLQSQANTERTLGRMEASIDNLKEQGGRLEKSLENMGRRLENRIDASVEEISGRESRCRDHEARLAALEHDKSRLLGARWAVRLVWALFSALGLGGVAALAAWLNSLLARG